MHKRSQHAVEQAEEQMHLLVSKDQPWRSFIHHFKVKAVVCLCVRGCVAFATACICFGFVFVSLSLSVPSFLRSFTYSIRISFEIDFGCIWERALDMLSMFSIHSDVACEKISVWVFVYKFAFAQHNKQSVLSVSPYRHPLLHTLLNTNNPKCCFFVKHAQPFASLLTQHSTFHIAFV